MTLKTSSRIRKSRLVVRRERNIRLMQMRGRKHQLHSPYITMHYKDVGTVYTTQYAQGLSFHMILGVTTFSHSNNLNIIIEETICHINITMHAQ